MLKHHPISTTARCLPAVEEHVLTNGHVNASMIPILFVRLAFIQQEIKSAVFAKRGPNHGVHLDYPYMVEIACVQATLPALMEALYRIAKQLVQLNLTVPMVLI
jgi:hypothetical protein